MAITATHPEFIASSDRSLIVYCASDFSLHAHRLVVHLLQTLQRRRIQGITTISPGYLSVMIRFDPLLTDHLILEDQLRGVLVQAPADEIALTSRTLKIPVCYEGSFAPDLDELAAAHRISPKEVIRLHSSATYSVYFLGFVPGFAYMGEVPESIATPRRPAPRKVVPAGSVGIAGRQTGIYPASTPGGWNLIGRCPLRLFHPARDPASLLLPGDRVQFCPVAAEEFERLEREAG